VHDSRRLPEAVENLHLPAFVIAQVGGEGEEPRRDLLAHRILRTENRAQELGHDFAEAVVLGRERCELGSERGIVPGQEPEMTFLALEMALEARAEMVKLTTQSAGPGAHVTGLSTAGSSTLIEKIQELRNLPGQIAMLLVDGAKDLR
jgi:hypothetical protein